jgi:hypothetical protein
MALSYHYVTLQKKKCSKITFFAGIPHYGFDLSKGEKKRETLPESAHNHSPFFLSPFASVWICLVRLLGN